MLYIQNGVSASQPTPPPPHVQTRDVYLPTVLLTQKMINCMTIRRIVAVDPSSGFHGPSFTTFYQQMTAFAAKHALLDEPPAETQYAPSQLKSLRALWHYCCLAYLTRLDLIEEGVGRSGTPRADTIADIEAWAQSVEARLAFLHAAHILMEAEDLRDMAFIVPR